MRLYGRKILKEALKAGVRIKKVFFADLESPERSFLELVEEVERRGIRYSFVSKRKADNLVGEKSQGVVFEIGDFEYSSLTEAFEKTKGDFIILLDQVQDPHNFGAIIRTSVAAGVDFIVIPKDRSVKVTAAVVKVSAGLVFRMPIVVVTNMARTVEELKEKGIWVYGTARDGKVYHEVDLTDPVGLVLGNEGRGVRRLVLERCDDVLTIPMEEGVDSLNVSVSAGILIYEVRRQRGWK